MILLLLSLLVSPYGDARPDSSAVWVAQVADVPDLDSLSHRPPTAEGDGHYVTDFRQRTPGDGVPSSLGTSAWVSFDQKNLTVIFVCSDDPKKTRAHLAKREDISGDDQVVVYLDTFRDGQRAYMFASNPVGIQLDGIVTEGQDDDYSFDTLWHAEGRLTATGYLVRMTIPFRSLRFSSATTQTWRIALGRVIPRNNEKSYWPYITKRIKGFVPQFAELQGLSHISPGRNIQLNPYTTLARARFLDDEEDAAAFRTLGDERIGLDAKMVVRDAFTLDATVNPDFSQVESDDPQATANERFEVFFPEKRPFFIENAGYFQTPVNLFFSRRIVDPGGGLRLTGKLGRWAMGAIAINDREPGRVRAPDPLAGSRAGVGALRVQRELGEESTVGFLVTDRELEGSSNRVFSFDNRLKLGKNWAFAGQVIQSETRELDGQRLSGFGALAGLEREGRNFDYSGHYLRYDPDFTAPLGFVRRVGLDEMEHELEYTWRPKDRAVLSYGPSLSVLYNWDPAGTLLDREIGTQFQVELGGETEIEVERTEAFELFEGLGFHPHNNAAALTSEWFKWLALEASYEWGTAVNHDPPEDVAPFLGRATEAELNLTLRPTPRLRVDQVFIHSRLNTSSGQRVFTERALRSKVNYQFSRALSVRGIVDYEAEDATPALFDEDEREREWGVDLLLTYLVNPGTALYVGYTDKYENVALVPGTPPTVEPRRSPETSTGRQLFVKLSYLRRF